MTEKLCEHDNCLISSLRGLRNGIYYGAKIRLVHSLVMTILFKEGKLEEKLKSIFQLTYTHAKNLGIYVFIYKLSCCILKRLLNSKSNAINFIAGLIGSYFMWSDKNPVNQQIMLYLLSRNLLAITNYFNKRYLSVWNNNIPIDGFKYASILCWGVVMYLFESNPNLLQTSLFSSMDFLYNESNKYSSIKDFVPFYLPDWVGL